MPKPLASGRGITCSILLAEPDIFVSGFDHDSHVQQDGQVGTSLLRGRLQIMVSKNAKIKAIQLKLIGRARTDWLQGISSLKQRFVEEERLMTQVLTIFNAMNDGWQTESGHRCTYRPKTSAANTANLAVLPTGDRLMLPSATPVPGLTAKEIRRLPLQSQQSRSIWNGENCATATTHVRAFKTFYPGTYDYSFVFPIGHHHVETTKLQYGAVTWKLEATVDRAGTFKPSLHCMKEVSIVRIPGPMSLAMTEPISLSGQWKDQLHYDIVISGKSFPIGSKIPITLKLTPLAKIHVHKLEIYVTESTEYRTNDRDVTKNDQERKIPLLEKAAGSHPLSSPAPAEITIVRGGEPSAAERSEAREVAQRRRAADASRTHRTPEPLPEPTANLLGDLDLGLESMWDSTEIEANAQIPTCTMMTRNKDLRLHADCSWKNINVHHWIKVVMRASRLDSDGSPGTARRPFDISVGSPLTILNCRATRANTDLPAYSSPSGHPSNFQPACGCPDAASTATDVTPNSFMETLPSHEMPNSMRPASQGAHLSVSATNSASESVSTQSSLQRFGTQREPRLVHLLRAPSFNPPAFDDDIAPPPAVIVDTPDTPNAAIVTPPPQYDAVVGTPSVDGLANYFARLADAYHGDEDLSAASNV